MPHYFNEAILPAGRSFVVGEVQYPANVLDLWSADALTEIGVTWVAPPEPEPPTLAELKAAKNRNVVVRREAAFSAGFSPSAGPLAGHTLQVRHETDKINWLTSATSYSAAVSAGAGAVAGATFRTLVNETVVVTYAQGLTVIVQDMAAWGQQIMGRSWVLKDAIDAAVDVAALDAINIEAGWPA